MKLLCMVLIRECLNMGFRKIIPGVANGVAKSEAVVIVDGMVYCLGNS